MSQLKASALMVAVVSFQQAYQLRPKGGDAYILLECGGALDKAFVFTGLSFLIYRMGIIVHILPATQNRLRDQTALDTRPSVLLRISHISPPGRRRSGAEREAKLPDGPHHRTSRVSAHFHQEFLTAFLLCTYVTSSDKSPGLGLLAS